MKKAKKKATTAKTTEKKAPTRWVIVRGYSSGVFYGRLIAHPQLGHVILSDCRRLWQWCGALTLSHLATIGTVKPDLCKFTPPTQDHEVLNAIEIIPVTDAAKTTIDAVKPWTI